MQDLCLGTPVVSTMLLAGRPMDLSVLKRQQCQSCFFSYPPKVSLAFKTVLCQHGRAPLVWRAEVNTKPPRSALCGPWYWP
ncbi:hypothetical protein DVA81_18795, partial [Acinetobacter baumannii]